MIEKDAFISANRCNTTVVEGELMNQRDRTYGNMKMGVPWLSVIIPVYNAEGYLPKCLDSIRRQSFIDYEVILVDDGSTDESSKICMSYQKTDPRFLYYEKENGGSFRARVFGAEKAKGKYITFCDADDYYCTDHAFSKMFKEVTESDCEVLQFGFCKKFNHIKQKVQLVDQTINVTGEEYLDNEYPKLLCSSWEESHITPNVWNKVYRRDLTNSLPNSDKTEKVFWGDDLIMNLHMLESCRDIRFIPDVLYNYRQLSGDTKKFSLSTMNDLNIIKQYQTQFLENYNGNAKERIIRNMHGETAGWLFYYVRQAISHIEEDKLRNLIQKTLKLKAFVLSRQYFLENTEEKWDAVNLLREAKADDYLTKAKEYNNKERSVKETVIAVLKTIYRNI